MAAVIAGGEVRVGGRIAILSRPEPPAPLEPI